MTRPIKLGVLLSGGGTTMQNILNRIEARQLDARVVVVGSSRPDAFGLERAKSAGVDAFVCATRDYHGDFKAQSDAINRQLLSYEVDLVILAGFMCYYHVPDALRYRVMNIHPALIPAFCGQGFYGRHVHDAVLAAAVKVTGCTVHFVDEHYDHGPIIIQRTCPVLDDDTPESLAARVFEEECIAYPTAIQRFAEGRLSICGRWVRVLEEPAKA